MRQRIVKFTAVQVRCSEAGDWEIVQVSFDSEKDCPEMGELNYDWKEGIIFSVNFEFSGIPHVEWHDGKEFGGGKIKEFRLYRSQAYLDTWEDIKFEIKYSLDEERYIELVEYLNVIFSRIPGKLTITK